MIGRLQSGSERRLKGIKPSRPVRFFRFASDCTITGAIVLCESPELYDTLCRSELPKVRSSSARLPRLIQEQTVAF
jgi:hypothetical protein